MIHVFSSRDSKIRVNCSFQGSSRDTRATQNFRIVSFIILNVIGLHQNGPAKWQRECEAKNNKWLCLRHASYRLIRTQPVVRKSWLHNLRCACYTWLLTLFYLFFPVQREQVDKMIAHFKLPLTSVSKLIMVLAHCKSNTFLFKNFCIIVNANVVLILFMQFASR